MTGEFIRRCPGCGSENSPSNLRCACGILLAGVDIVRQQDAPETIPVEPEPAVKAEQAASAASVSCPHDDCGQANPPGTTNCLYCNRPIADAAPLTPTESLHSLVNLPAALRERYRIVKPMPVRGAEAELLIVQAVTGGPQRVAKIFRHGILPRREVQERIRRVPVAHRIELLEEGISDGHAYELMELCEHGSLRDMVAAGALAPDRLRDIIRELATALQDVHSAGLVHRDLKPENILLRSREPLDLVLTDFSTSSILDVTQRFTGVARTLPYASPESLSGVIDFKCDFWAMGMLVLECATGKHPFAGLSEAVIMHHLTTRNIDLSTMKDSKLHKLLLGLLQRDPGLRWGANEVQRWLADDPMLADPVVHGNIREFSEPYHIGNEICYEPKQLAVALSRNWKAGVADLSNGQLLTWFRDVQKDQNVVRLLLDMQQERGVSLHQHLLRLILHLAPGIPMVWMGETIELSTILGYANRALKGEKEAAQWLDNLYQYHVLEVYAGAGNRQADDLVKRWGRAVEQFMQAWKDKMAVVEAKSAARDPDEIPDFDQLMYGRHDRHRPALVNLHARLLATAYDNSWAERLRKRLMAELAELSAQSAWIADLGDPAQMDAASLLVLESLLPEARKSVAHQVKKQVQLHAEREREYREVRDALHSTIATIRSTASERLAMPFVSEELRIWLEDYHGLVAMIESAGRADKEWQDLKKQALRSRAIAKAMLELLDDLGRHRAISRGWFSMPVMVTTGLVILLLPMAVPISRLWPVLLVIALVSWRLSEDYRIMRSIQELGKVF